jgi:hypothetical protein
MERKVEWKCKRKIKCVQESGYEALCVIPMILIAIITLFLCHDITSYLPSWFAEKDYRLLRHLRSTASLFRHYLTVMQRLRTPRQASHSYLDVLETRLDSYKKCGSQSF